MPAYRLNLHSDRFGDRRLKRKGGGADERLAIEESLRDADPDPCTCGAEFDGHGMCVCG